MFSKLKSWKTTVAGFLGGLILVAQQVLAAIDGDPETKFTVALLLTGLGMMGIGFFARDNNKRSEDVIDQPEKPEGE
jgi:hypothetical protein